MQELSSRWPHRAAQQHQRPQAARAARADAGVSDRDSATAARRDSRPHVEVGDGIGKRLGGELFGDSCALPAVAGRHADRAGRSRRSRLAAPRSADRPSSDAANGTPTTRYRLKSRLGSWHRRWTHSRPIRCIHSGARRTWPAKKAEAVADAEPPGAGQDRPQPGDQLFLLGRAEATNTMSGLASDSFWMIVLISFGLSWNPKGGKCVPAI